MKIVGWLLMLALAGVGAVGAAEPASQTYAAPIDKVWTATERVLKQLGWDIDKSDRTIGWVTTDSRRIEGQGEDWGVYAKGARHRLTLTLKPAGENRTTISIERTVFHRERILWMDKDEPLTSTDQNVEKAILAAIERGL